MATRKKKATTKRTATKKGVEKSAVETSPSGSDDAQDPMRTWSLDELAEKVPAVDPTSKEIVLKSLLRAHSDDDLLALGTDFRTEDILAAAPGFTLGVLKALGVVSAPIPGLALALVPLYVDQAQELARINTAFERHVRSVSSTLSGLRSRLKTANSKALRARREVARTLLNNVLPYASPIRAELIKAASKAATPAATVASVRAVADILERLLADSELSPVLTEYRYTTETVDELRAQAAEVELLSAQGAELTPPQEIDQRVLDRQDGLVIAIMRAIWNPLRSAKANGARIDLPPAGELDRLFSRASTSTADEDDELEPTETEPPTPPVDPQTT